jgi:uncharacterized protein YjiS (DUF1127 family)
MRNEHRAVFDRASEPCHFAFILPPADDECPSAGRPAAAEPLAGRSMFTRLTSLIIKTLRQRRNRLALMELTDDQLKDIGLSRSQAYSEDHDRYRRSASHTLERNAR